MASKKREFLAFDLDGTVLDSAEAIAITTNDTLSKFGFPFIDSVYIKSTIGRPISEVFSKVTSDNKVLEEMLLCFRELLATNSHENTSIFPGIIESFESLKNSNIGIAVVTNKSTDLAKRVIKSLGISSYFDLVVGQDLAKPKPAPDMLNLLSKEYELSVLAMCGDTVDDVLCAKEAEITSIAIASGSQSYDTLRKCSPNFLINSALELNELLTEKILK